MLFDEGGMGTWTGYPAFLCRTLPPVELRTHISFTGVPFYGHPCWQPASPDASDAFWRDSTIPTQRFPRTPLPLTSLLPWKTLTETEMLSTTLVNWPQCRMGKDTLERCYSTLMQVAMNCSYWIAILLTRDIPTVPGSFWVWIPPMSTNIRVRCYLLNCRRGTLKMYSALPPEGLNTITLTLVQPKAFKQHFARCEHSLSNSPDDSQAITVYDYTAGRCCLYRIVTNWSTHVLGPLITAGYAAVWFLARGHGGLSSRRYVARAGHSLIRIQEWPVACNLLCFSAWVANRPRPTCTSQAIQVHTWAFLFHCLSVIFRRCQYK